jgi:hypothetical protein
LSRGRTKSLSSSQDNQGFLALQAFASGLHSPKSGLWGPLIFSRQSKTCLDLISLCFFHAQNQGRDKNSSLCEQDLIRVQGIQEASGSKSECNLASREFVTYRCVRHAVCNCHIHQSSAHRFCFKEVFLLAILWNPKTWICLDVVCSLKLCIDLIVTLIIYTHCLQWKSWILLPNVMIKFFFFFLFFFLHQEILTETQDTDLCRVGGLKLWIDLICKSDFYTCC